MVATTLSAERSYLDHNATTPLRPEARDAMAAAAGAFGNPSSVHAEGRAARAVIDAARREVGRLVGTEAEDVVFTSGGTEALNMALTGGLAVAGSSPPRLLVGAGEHPAVAAGHRFADVAVVPLRPDGRLDVDALDAMLTDAPAILAIQAANNETGVIQPVRDAAERVRAGGGVVICDGVQAAGKIACDFEALRADVIAISAHKFGGPKGIGALCFRDRRSHLQEGVVRGGGQERGLRSGTENVIGIAGFGAACLAANSDRPSLSAAWAGWRDRIEVIIRAAVPDAMVMGEMAPRLPNTTCFALPGVDAQVLMMALDLAGVAVSTGSACAAGVTQPSRVLVAMGVEPALAARALRVSLGWTTSSRDIDMFATALSAALQRMTPRIAA